jgi:aminopeptidase-like protein
LSRTPYAEYHTSNDNPSIIDMDRLKESSEVTRLIVDILDTDRKLRPTFIGQPFLTRYGLFHDHTEGPEAQMLNRIQEDVYSYSDGKTSLFEIADRFRYDWQTVKEQAERLMKAKLLV